MAHGSDKLRGSIEGALAGGGDPATSPLYVFGPFLRMIVASGVAAVVFGAAIWLAVLTVFVVSAMYRLVMIWVTDGSGGSGLSEDEFGGWAVNINAGITAVEYTLTFLVSIAALVTFVADRFAVLNVSYLGLSLRTILAAACALLVGFAVNLGPRVAARAFGPATAAVLLLLWTLMIATIVRFGLRLPSIDWSAFAVENLHATLGGYARILALMTGIEIFANLVPAYRGSPRERSRKAFGSLVIVMTTTCLTMLIVGPAIFALADPSNRDVSVFTQTMDALLPAPLAYAGTLIGVLVLLSAAAASAQGVQNLSLGLRERHYVPAWFGQRNAHGVAANPVWLEVGLCVVCFGAFGTSEETYLTLYAAGVFILLSLAAWATVKRLVRQLRKKIDATAVAALVGAAAAAILSSGATVIIFEERFTQGAWLYLVIIPLLYLAFSRIRRRLGPPRSISERLGRAQLVSSVPPPPKVGAVFHSSIGYRHILVPLDQSPTSELALPQAQMLARNYGGSIHLLSVVRETPSRADVRDGRSHQGAAEYLEGVGSDLSADGYEWKATVRAGVAAEVIGEVATAGDIDLVIISTRSHSRLSHWVKSHVTREVVHQSTPPLLLIRATDVWPSIRTRFRRLLVPLDGSDTAEQILPHVEALARRFGSEVTLLAVVEGSELDDHLGKLRAYLESIAEALREAGIPTETQVADMAPVEVILNAGATLRSDLIMMVSHGRGGVERMDRVKLGSVVEDVIERTPCPVFMVSAERDLGARARLISSVVPSGRGSLQDDEEDGAAPRSLSQGRARTP